MKKQPLNAWSLPFRYLVGCALFVAIVALVLYAREGVKALVVAAFVAYVINPAVVLLTRNTRLTRPAAVNVVYFSALILLVGLPSTLTPIFFEEIKIIAQDILTLSREISATLSKPIAVGGMRFEFQQMGEGIAHLQDTLLKPLPEQALQLLETTSVSILWFLVVLVGVYAFLSEWPRIRSALITFGPPESHEEMRELYKRVRRVWMSYLRGQIVLMFIVGVAFTIAWFIVGIPGALVLGVIAGLFTLVPDVGPFVAAAMAVGVALLEGSNWIPLSNFWVAGIVALVYFVLINIKNFLLRPYIMGRSVHMNEAVIFISIIIATILEGIMGALLIVPLLASVVVIFDYLRRRVMGLPPFEEDGSQPFTASPEELKPRRLALPKPKKRT
ncbi:MAG: AI-2E family transporter [Anaerolineales bacterium]